MGLEEQLESKEQLTGKVEDRKIYDVVANLIAGLTTLGSGLLIMGYEESLNHPNPLLYFGGLGLGLLGTYILSREVHNVGVKYKAQFPPQPGFWEDFLSCK